MPLPPTTDREELHARAIDMRGYRRADGLYDIEGHITDVKTHPLHPPGRASPMPPGIPVHDMWVRLVVDGDLVIKDVVVAIDNGPYDACPSATSSLAPLIGEKIGAGWSARVRALRGPHSCTHVVELLIPLATAAYQTLAPERFQRPDALDKNGRPIRIDSCHAYSSNGALVLARWPEHYTGNEDKTQSGGSP